MYIFRFFFHSFFDGFSHVTSIKEHLKNYLPRVPSTFNWLSEIGSIKFKEHTT